MVAQGSEESGQGSMFAGGAGVCISLPVQSHECSISFLSLDTPIATTSEVGTATLLGSVTLLAAKEGG